MIEERLEKFLGRFADFQKSGEPMTVSLGYAAYTAGGYDLLSSNFLLIMLYRCCDGICLCKV